MTGSTGRQPAQRELTSPSPRPPHPSQQPAAAWIVHPTAIGPLLLAATERGLVQLAFHADPRTVSRVLDRLAGRLGGTAEHAPHDPFLRLAVQELDAYFHGGLRAFTIALDWQLTSGFSRRVLQELATSVPYGAVVSYQDLAQRVGEPGAARAVGMAMGSNPLPVVVPCHRVWESDGGIGGFGGGLETKRALLAREGVLPEPMF